MDEPLDLNKKRAIPEVTYSVIANRIDKWEYVGGHVGHLWMDLRNKKHNGISDIIQSYFVRNKQAKFMIDWEKGELFAYE